MTLADLCRAQDTDKGPSGRNATRGVFPGHNYTAAYEAMFSASREQVRRLLELGLWSGGSLRVWTAYFPNAEIHGLDTDFSRLDMTGLSPDRVRVWHGDQTDVPLLESIAGEAGGFDLVIDDASHQPMQQTASLHALWPHVRAGGWYVIEDVERDVPRWAATWGIALERTPRIIPSALARECAAIAFQR